MGGPPAVTGDDNADGNDLNDQQKLQLAERANEIYRQQLKYMQDHLASLRSLIQDKENIIENLMLRYDLGIISQDPGRQAGNLGADEIEQNELRRKAEALAQRTILENFELREMVNELRDENFHLRNEIYELQDKINHQVLHVNKLEKTLGINGIDTDDLPELNRQFSAYIFKAHSQRDMSAEKRELAVFGYIREAYQERLISDSVLKICLRFYSNDENSVETVSGKTIPLTDTERPNPPPTRRHSAGDIRPNELDQVHDDGDDDEDDGGGGGDGGDGGDDDEEDDDDGAATNMSDEARNVGGNATPDIYGTAELTESDGKEPEDAEEEDAEQDAEQRLKSVGGRSSECSELVTLLTDRTRRISTDVPNPRRSSLPILSSESVEIPSVFLCPITKKLMSDPVVAFDGMTYEKSAISKYLEQHNRSPVTGAAAVFVIIPNVALKMLIEEFLSVNGHNMTEEVAASDAEAVETEYL